MCWFTTARPQSTHGFGTFVGPPCAGGVLPEYELSGGHAAASTGAQRGERLLGSGLPHRRWWCALAPLPEIVLKRRKSCVGCADSGMLAYSAGILYHDMYAHDLVGAHVEMRSLEVGRPGSAIMHVCRCREEHLETEDRGALSTAIALTKPLLHGHTGFSSHWYQRQRSGMGRALQRRSWWRSSCRGCTRTCSALAAT